MAYVTPSSQSLKVAFSNRYSLPHFQREYKWEPRHFEELINDVQDAFLLAFDPSHGRGQVADYVPYFLGSIITANETAGKKSLIDGQQRLTSAFVLLTFLHRFVTDKSVKTTADLSNYVGNISFGIRDYPIGFSNTRKQIFDLYLDTSQSAPDALDQADGISGLDQGDRRIIEALRSLDNLLDHKVLDNVAYFIDFVIEKVVLIDISVDKESEAHRVFVTMNDRGLRLGPIDLLKGEILSRIPSQPEVDATHKAWVQTVNLLREIDPEEDSLFFRHFFRAQWGQTIRGKSKGDSPGDYDLIGDAYHRWFSENVARLGLSTTDDYVEFARVMIPKYAEIYAFIRKAESELIDGFEDIFYNAVRRYSFQPMVLLAAVSPSDKRGDWRRKIAVTAKLIDLILTTRTIEGKANNYDNLKEISFALTKEVRGKDVAGVECYVRTEWPAYCAALPKLRVMSYLRSDKSHLLYILARIGSFLEEEFGATNRVGFETYWRRDKGHKTFDIEHVLRHTFNTGSLPANHGFADQHDYLESRNKIGALILLPRSRNRSLQAKPYRDKLGVYSNEGVLTQTLDAGLYDNNPKVTAFLQANPDIKLASISDFGKSDIQARAEAYVGIAKLIWKMP